MLVGLHRDGVNIAGVVVVVEHLTDNADILLVREEALVQVGEERRRQDHVGVEQNQYLAGCLPDARFLALATCQGSSDRTEMIFSRSENVPQRATYRWQYSIAPTTTSNSFAGRV